MTVNELKEKLNEFDGDMEVLTKKTEILGNVGFVFSVRKDSYSFFGADVPCVLITDESEEGEHE